MKLHLQENDREYQFNLDQAIDISIAVQRKDSVSSFQIPGADYRDYEDGDFIGRKQRGGPCNLETITFTPHGNGTHTECVGHIALEPYYVKDCIEDQFVLAQLWSLRSKAVEGGIALDFDSCDWEQLRGMKSLVIRSMPNPRSKHHTDYSGQGAAFILPEDMRRISDAGIAHLLVDLPSVDPEWDGGRLLSHHIFWNYPEAPRTHASITEFIYVPEQVPDGLYLLKLNIGNFISDASPSTPILYPKA